METPLAPAHDFSSEQAKAYFADFLEDPSLDFVNDTFEYDTDDAAETAEALLAAEIVAAAIGNPAAGLPAEVVKAIKGAPNKKLMQRARTAVRAALEPTSTLAEAWAMGPDPTLSAVKNLLERLT